MTEAKELHIEAVNQLRTTLGEDHPSTVSAIANLASFHEEHRGGGRALHRRLIMLKGGPAEGAASRAQSEVRGVLFFNSFAFLVFFWYASVPHHDGRTLPRQGNVRWVQEGGDEKKARKDSSCHSLFGPDAAR